MVRKEAFPFLLCLHTSKNHHLCFVSESLDPEFAQCFQFFPVERITGIDNRQVQLPAFVLFPQHTLLEA